MAVKAKAAVPITINPPNMKEVAIRIVGTAPLVVNAFSAKSRQKIIEDQMRGPAGAKKPKREPKNFDELYEGAFHRSTEGWYGFPCSAFRKAMISACRLCDVTMTMAKLCVFVKAEGFDALEGCGLVRIEGEPERLVNHVRLDGPNQPTDIRIRPMWRKWSAVVTVKYDADQLKLSDAVNLLARAGMQVGIGEGRPDSKKSAGQDMGTWECVEGVNA
jgi:hypothetical protein